MTLFIEWNEDYNLGFKEIDQQHKKLVDIINVLYDSYIKGERDTVLDQVISDLKDYGFIHFKEEETHFNQCNYEDTENHIAEHHHFLKKIQEFHRRHLSNDDRLMEELFTFLKDWLTNHIMVSDRKYVETFKKFGVQ